jgi:hypothetical protein
MKSLGAVSCGDRGLLTGDLEAKKKMREPFNQSGTPQEFMEDTAN